MQTAIGVDLGGSHVTAGIVSDAGTLGKQFVLDIEDSAFDTVITSVVDVIEKALAEAGRDVVGIGIGSAGNIDPKSGEVLYSPNLGWERAPLGDRVRAHFPKQKVFVGNDARCATLGEYTFGIGRKTENFVLLTLGTGIGGGIVGGGHLILGNRNGAGEVGHHQIRPTDGFACSCGKRGCFEAQASGTGLIRHAMALAPSFPRSTLLDVPREKIGSKKIRRAAQAGDLHALAAWKNFCADLSLGLANIIAFTNPELIALGGGVSTAGDFMLDAVRGPVEEMTTMVPRKTTRIEIAKLGNDAGQVGAATMAFRGGLKTKIDE
jgi:glucokinase